MDLKEKNKNLDNLTNKELVQLVKFYLQLVNKSFIEAEQCKNCNESCCDIFNNNYNKVISILNKVIDVKKIDNEEKNFSVKERKLELPIHDIEKEVSKDYLASVEFSNLEKKYK